MKRQILLFLPIFLVLGLASCVVVGRSSRGGWFVWPGGLTLLILLLVVFLLLRRR